MTLWKEQKIYTEELDVRTQKQLTVSITALYKVLWCSLMSLNCLQRHFLLVMLLLS